MGTDPEQHLSVTSETSRKVSPISKDYRTEVGKIILKNRLAAGQPSLDREELAMMVEAWSEVLYSSIPQHRLNDSYIEAARSSDSYSGVSALDMNLAYKELRAAALAAPRVDVSHRLTTDYLCPDCFNTGTKTITQGILTYGAPCNHTQETL